MDDDLTDWWETLFEQMLRVSLSNLMRMEESTDDSIEAITLLMEAADHFHFLQQAYHEKCGGVIHVEFINTDGCGVGSLEK
tara:strand:+ start:124 stop:366 length:243 start_codon:yes stop_codon:yes gene_type:complete